MIKELPKDMKYKNTKQKSNPHHPQSFKRVKQSAMTMGTLPDTAGGAPRTGTLVGMDMALSGSAR